MGVDKRIFYNESGVLNRNKLRENWIFKNYPEFHLKIINHDIPDGITVFSQKIYHYINNMDGYPLCPNCGGVNLRWKSFTTGYVKCCSRKCANMLSRPQVEETRRLNTLLKHGVCHTSMLKSVKDKQSDTNIKIYGHVSPACNINVHNKMLITNNKKYGCDYVMQSKEIVSRFKNNRIIESIETVIDRYSLDVIAYDGSLFKIKCSDCNGIYEINRNLLYHRIERYEIETCLLCNPLNSNRSRYEDELYNYLNDFDIKIIRNHRIDNKEIDIYLPDFKFGVEINGLYWHSELNRANDYHLNKSIFFTSKGIDIMHVWEDEWLEKKDIIKSMIIDKLGLCVKNNIVDFDIRIVSNKEVKEFYIYNHIDGYVKSDISVGLYSDDNLISAISFTGECNYDTRAYDIIQHCTTSGISNSESFVKLLNYFTNSYVFTSISINVNYDKISIFNNVYLNLGFEFDKLTKPGYYWCKNMKRYNRYNFRKDKLVRNGYDVNKTEVEIMHDRGYYRIWDCGNLKFTFSNKKKPTG